MLYRLSYVPLAPCADPYRPPQGGHPCEAVPDLSARGDTASELSCAAARAASSPRAVSNRRPLPCRGSALPLSYTARPRRRRGEAPAPGIEPGTIRLTVGRSAAELCRIMRPAMRTSWRWLGSNQRHPAYEAGALTSELHLHGRDDRTRTCDLVLPEHARYRLRHIPEPAATPERRDGVTMQPPQTPHARSATSQTDRPRTGEERPLLAEGEGIEPPRDSRPGYRFRGGHLATRSALQVRDHGSRGPGARHEVPSAERKVRDSNPRAPRRATA